MQLKWYERLIIALSGLLIVCAVLLEVAVLVFKPELRTAILAEHIPFWYLVAYCTVLALLLAIGFFCFPIAFRRSTSKGSVIQKTELGEVRISINALKTMINRCIDSHHELSIRSEKIYKYRNGIVVELLVTMATGLNIPLTVNALQKQIKQYITSCSGIDVYEVRVNVETSNGKVVANSPVDIPQCQTTSVVEESFNEHNNNSAVENADSLENVDSLENEHVENESETDKKSFEATDNDSFDRAMENDEFDVEPLDSDDIVVEADDSSSKSSSH